MIRVPDQASFMGDDVKSHEVWYRFFIDMVNGMPITGSVAPEGVIKANDSCLYVLQSGGSAQLWVNETGSGSKTGWVAK